VSALNFILSISGTFHCKIYSTKQKKKKQQAAVKNGVALKQNKLRNQSWRPRNGCNDNNLVKSPLASLQPFLDPHL